MTTGIQKDAGVNAAVKARQQAMWASGDFAVIGTTLQIVGEVLCESVDIRAGQRVLDVAAGNGNATLAAARRFASVTSTDYVPALLERGQRRADADGLSVVFQEADAEALPFADASFDRVISTFGVMFAPDHDKAAAEMLRVCRPGGRIGLASWTPAGFVGKLFKVTASHVPPIPGVQSPLLWGTNAHIQELFAGSTTIDHVSRFFTFRYRSPQHFVDVFRAYYGPTHKAFAALDEGRQAALEADLLALLEQNNISREGDLVVPGEYLETVILK
ncbi:MAG TPA: class I SAM-dependent methyltransferase [Vicinamibacterales bacterium]|nr:class I SAM-dependent methyltransferase [Vicinamibacterales bacterium]